MADPFSWGMAGMASSAGGGVLGVLGSIMKGNATSGMYQYQAGIARMNEKIMKQNADYARTVGENEAQRIGIKTAQTIGQQTAAQAASGLDVNTGSNAQIRESQHMVGFTDQSTARANAARRAYGYEVEAVQEAAKADMYYRAAGDAQDAIGLNSLTSILGAATSVSSKWLQGNQMGLWGSDRRFGTDPTAYYSG